MSHQKVRFLQFLEILLLLFICLFLIRQLENYDFWFHAKYGEYILATHALPFKDVFSHTAYGNSAVPYEWLFQVFIYLVFHYFNFIGVQIVVIVLTLAYILLFRKILIEIFQMGVISRMILSASLYILGYNYWVERPQLAAYLLFMMTLYLVLARIFLSKNRLWLLPFIFIIWTNLHASMILGLYLLFAYAGFFALRYLVKKDRANLHLSRDLLGWGLISFIATILPPLGTKVYRLLILFFEKRDFIARAIDEWVPLYQLEVRYYLYLVIFGLAAVCLVYAFIKKYDRSKLAYFIPLIPLSLFVITGVRHTSFTLPATLLLFIPGIQVFKTVKNNLVQNIFAVLILILSILGMYAYYNLTNTIATGYPKNAIPFIKEYLKGNMFNEYTMGGYLMYQLGPDIKTFIDGRTDMFLPKVLPEYLYLSWLTDVDDSLYLTEFNRLVDRYHISWVILTTNRFSLSWRLARILGNDPSWSLIYFDDATKIYVKDDGVDKIASEKFGMKAATPLGKTLYRKNLKEQAYLDYQEMYNRVKSAVSANALGFMLLEDGKYDEARKLFLEAVKIKPDAGSPKMNLAELSVHDGDYQEAITLYRQAINDEPDRGLAYLRLGQLIIDSGGDKSEAKSIWTKGLGATPDEEILAKIRRALKDTN